MISLSIIINLLKKINHNYIVTQTYKKYRKNKNFIYDCMAYKTHDHRSHSAVVSKVHNGLKNSKKIQSGIYGHIELDSHADTTVAGSNCVLLAYTGRECDVTPYDSSYEPARGIPIVHAATAWQSQHTGQTYILVFNESLWMPQLPNTLVNPNQLRYFGTEVQDNPYSGSPLYIKTEDSSFGMELQSQGTTIFAHTFSPSQHELETCPMIQLTSQHPWNPHQINFPTPEKSFYSIMEEANLHNEQCQISSMISKLSSLPFQNYIPSNNKTEKKRTICQVGEILQALPTKNLFSSGGRHSDVSTQLLSERWYISPSQALKTLKNTSQKFLRSAILPLSRRYRADRHFYRKNLRGKWSTDTMDGRVLSLAGNRYAQVFANSGYFSKLYPITTKGEAGDALKKFCLEFGVPESLTFDGSKEQCCKGTEFMSQIRKHDIDFHISEKGYHNQNPVEGVIQELRRKWYRVMVRKQVPVKLWDYGFQWVSEIQSLTYTEAGGINTTPICEITGETPDISEYLDFGFYDKVMYHDNAGMGPRLPGRWLGVSHRTGNLMCYFILTKTGEVISRSSVQAVTELELQTEEFISMRS